jgi:hypothetical protein
VQEALVSLIAFGNSNFETGKTLAEGEPADI